jgi:hypothetical protein
MLNKDDKVVASLKSEHGTLNEPDPPALTMAHLFSDSYTIKVGKHIVDSTYLVDSGNKQQH